MKFLLDSNVISEMRKPRPHGAVVAWLESTDQQEIGIPSIVLGELQSGAELTRRQDAAKAAELDEWIDEIARGWQVVEMNAAIAREWAKLVDRKNRALFEDAIIAATARVHSMTVVTRNTKDFERFSAQVLNPFLTPRKRQN